MNGPKTRQLADIINKYEFQNEELRDQAFTHRSFCNEKKKGDHNEVLEFLGDSVLDLFLAEILMEIFPEEDEGRLTKKRASLVNENSLFQIALDLGFEKRLKVGKGERTTGGTRKPRLLASVLEAYIGALYKDRGFVVVGQFVREIFEPIVKNKDWSVDFLSDYKTRLQELIQEKHKQVPEYLVSNETGPDHARQFEVQVKVLGEILASGEGTSKKQAEQNAAQLALEKNK